MFVFRKIWRALYSCHTRFEICPSALLPMSSSQVALMTYVPNISPESNISNILRKRQGNH